MKPLTASRGRFAVGGPSRTGAVADRLAGGEGLAAIAAAATAACGFVLAMRRLAGGFPAADPAVVWTVTAAFIALVAAVDLAARGGGSWVAPLAPRVGFVARLGLVAGVAAVSLPLRADAPASAAAMLVAVAVGAWPATRPRGRRAVDRGTPPDVRRPPRRDRPPAARPAGHRRPAPATVPGRLVQRLERYESDDGGDCLRGRVIVAIPVGGKVAHAHVGVCPSFPATPSVTLSTEYDGVDVVVTAAEVLPWGIRVECRLTEPAEEPLEIPVDLVARAPS